MSDLVPYSIVESIDMSRSGHYRGGPVYGLEGVKLQVLPSPGTKGKLIGVKSLNAPDELVIVEARIGDDYIWPQTALDVGMFNTMLPYVEMKIGEITEERPLDLFIQTMGFPAEPRTLNLVFFGNETPLSEEDKAKDQAFRDRRRGMLDAAAVIDWLKAFPDEYTSVMTALTMLLHKYIDQAPAEVDDVLEPYLEPLSRPGRIAADQIERSFRKLLADNQDAAVEVAAALAGLIQNRKLTEEVMDAIEKIRVGSPTKKVSPKKKKADGVDPWRGITPKDPKPGSPWRGGGGAPPGSGPHWKLSDQCNSRGEIKLPQRGHFLVAKSDMRLQGKNIVFSGDRVDVTSDGKVLINGKEVGTV